MTINRILLKNFKCFREVDVNLSKITLLTGGNSSGKSSLLYGLLAPFQSKGFPFYLSPNGKYVNMGDFEEISFNHLKDNEITIDISLSYYWGGENFQTVWDIDSSNRMPTLNYLRAEHDDLFDFEIKVNEVYVSNFNFKTSDKNVFSIRELKAKNLYELQKKLDDAAAGDIEMEARNPLFDLSHQKVSQSSLWDIEEMEATNPLFDLPETFREMDETLNFISSFRLHPDRTYYQKTKADDKVGRFGEGYIDQILEWENEKSEEFRQLNVILRDLGLLQQIRTRRLEGGRFELRVKVKSKGVWASLADVGFGVSQFLPIIVADLQLTQDSTLLLAQPEIHLHPSIQAALANYFVKQINASNKQYIIETHSEYLLNRIRLSIVKGEIKPSDLSVYYFENAIDGSKQYQIEFTKDGQIKNAPQGFFDTYMMDVMDIALHAEG